MERISAFVDGEGGDQDLADQVKRIKEDPELRAAWNTYLLIGDTLRGEKIGFSSDFNAKLSARLTQEPTVLAPRFRAPIRANVRRLALPVAASLGGMALVAWLALFNNPFTSQKENLALTAPPPMAAPTQLAANPPSEEVSDYLLAHQQFTPSTTMPGVASYVRTVSGQGTDQEP